MQAWRLTRFELKKILIVQKGFWVLAGCLLLKCLFLSFFPELKDPRIQLSQKQYDKYLKQVYGANTEEKASFIRQEHEHCEAVIGKKGNMEEGYRDGSVTEEEWQEYVLELDEAYLHQNAVTIFWEKEEQFPDVFVLFGILLMTAQCFSAEAAGGMLPLLLATKKGRKPLFAAKLSALSVTALVTVLAGNGLEAAVFAGRGWCMDSGAPLYSISLFRDISMLELSLGQAYLLSLGVRTLATLFYAGMFFGISVWMKNTTNLLFAALCVLCVPLILSGTLGAGILFTHMGLLCGSRMLQQLGASGIPWGISAGIVAAYSMIVVCLAGTRHQRGV